LAVTARAAIQREYARLAARYDRRWARYVDRTTARTLHHLRPTNGESILDLGCGTGTLIRAVLQRAPRARVVGLDLSPDMLRIASRGLGDRAGLAVADASLVPLRGAAFDAVVSVSSFHYWPDPARGLSEVARILRPGGRLVITDWCDDFWACRLCDRWLRLTRESYHRIQGVDQCRASTEGAGFTVERIERFKVSWLWGMMTLTARRSA
jgi:ubiquinone/menaquinone biosynthesis C-methylase UbiE